MAANTVQIQHTVITCLQFMPYVSFRIVSETIQYITKY